MNKWDTSDCVNMDALFYGCGRLTELDLTHFNMHKVKYVSYMFCDCSNLATVYANRTEDWSEEPSILSSEDMFRGCTSITRWDGTTDISKANTNGYFTIMDPGVYYKVSGSNIYFTNENKTGYTKYAFEYDVHLCKDKQVLLHHYLWRSQLAYQSFYVTFHLDL